MKKEKARFNEKVRNDTLVCEGLDKILEQRSADVGCISCALTPRTMKGPSALRVGNERSRLYK
jgi:hypothetical protein